MQHVLGFLPIYCRLKYERSILIKTKTNKGGISIGAHTIYNALEKDP
jgi:hypothetical protein